MLKYWKKILDNPDSLIHKIYLNLLQDCNNNNCLGGMNWASHIKTELDNLGLSYIWHNQLNSGIPIEYIRLRILDQFKQQWLSRINNSSRLKMYSRVKQQFSFESYLDQITTPKFRIALTRFKISAHNLQIEKGRHFGLNRTQRICKHCNLNVVESEFHFLLVCPFYSELRSKYFTRYFCHWPTLNKFDILMTKTPKHLLILSKFIYYANKKREDNE